VALAATAAITTSHPMLVLTVSHGLPVCQLLMARPSPRCGLLETQIAAP
jgi:hypothetical protein